MQHWAKWLFIVGQLLGAAILAWGIVRFVREGAAVPLLIALAILIGGPVEDLLTDWANRKYKRSGERAVVVHLIDLATSIGFLICLGLASILA